MYVTRSRMVFELVTATNKKLKDGGKSYRLCYKYKYIIKSRYVRKIL